jgi:hypothetical protein
MWHSKVLRMAETRGWEEAAAQVRQSKPPCIAKLMKDKHPALQALLWHEGSEQTTFGQMILGVETTEVRVINKIGFSSRVLRKVSVCREMVEGDL